MKRLIIGCAIFTVAVAAQVAVVNATHARRQAGTKFTITAENGM